MQPGLRPIARRQHGRAETRRALGGGETDKHLIYEGLSRVAADAVLAGAETIRGGDIVLSVWHPELVRLRASLGQAAASDSDRRDARAAWTSTTR